MPSRSSLLMKVMIGVLRIRQTSISLLVWVSTPLALSITIRARVHGGQHPVGVFGEVLMAGGVQQVDLIVAVIELHHRGGHRDAALLFNRHPVAGGVDRGFARFDRPRHLDGAAEEQQLFGQGGLAGIGMADDAEGAALLYFFEVLTAHVRIVPVSCPSGHPGAARACKKKWVGNRPMGKESKRYITQLAHFVHSSFFVAVRRMATMTNRVSSFRPKGEISSLATRDFSRWSKRQGLGQEPNGGTTRSGIPGRPPYLNVCISRISHCHASLHPGYPSRSQAAAYVPGECPLMPLLTDRQKDGFAG